MPKLVHTTPAQFPADPRMQGKKFRCIVRMVVDANGKPNSMEVEEAGAGVFGTAAVDAINRSKFKPGTLHGKAVPVRIEVWVPFVEGEKHAVPEVMPLGISFTDKNNRPPTPLRAVEPRYSDAAKLVRSVGIALVRTVVNEQGIPEDITVLQPVGHGLDDKVIEAVGKYRFSPALRWGIPVSCAVTIQVNFSSFR
jgi:TonB family protein